MGLWTSVLGLDEIEQTVRSTRHFSVDFCGFAAVGLGFVHRGFGFCLPWV